MQKSKKGTDVSMPRTIVIFILLFYLAFFMTRCGKVGCTYSTDNPRGIQTHRRFCPRPWPTFTPLPQPEAPPPAPLSIPAGNSEPPKKRVRLDIEDDRDMDDFDVNMDVSNIVVRSEGFKTDSMLDSQCSRT